MEITKYEAEIEAILFASGDPVPASRLCEVLALDGQTLDRLVIQLSDRLKDSGSALQVLKLNDEYQMASLPQYADPIRKALEIKRNTPLSQAAFEVLSAIAYNQPVTKSYVEQVRGVDCSGVISALSAKGLVEEHGRLDLPGRPLLYVTTPHFLRCFGLSSLDELPPIPDVGGQQTETPPDIPQSDGTYNTHEENPHT